MRKRRGYKNAEREVAKAEREYSRLEEEVGNTPAHTIEGMIAKIRCAEAWERDEIGHISGGCAEVMALSIFDDIKRLAAQRTT